MRMRLFLILIAATCGAPLVVQAQQIPAYEALRTVGRVQGQTLLGSLVEMRGADGDPQPVQWLLLFADPAARGGVRELVVSKKGVTSERTPVQPGPTSGVMAAAGLNLDSTGAFVAANEEAARVKLGFHSINYQLVNKNGLPVWVVRLFDASGHEVGAVDLSAKDGAVVTPLRQTPAPVAAVTTSTGAKPTPATASRGADSGWVEGGGLVGHVERWSENAWEDTSETAVKVGDSIGETAVKVGDSISAFFVGRPAKRAND